MEYQDKIAALKDLIENLPETERGKIEVQYQVNLDDVDASVAKLVEHFDETAERIIEITNQAKSRINSGSGDQDS